MAREVVTKRVYLKQAVFLVKEGAPTIQEKIELALKKLNRMGDRKEVLGEDNRHVRSVIYHRTHANMQFGIFASYERGTHQLIVSEDDEAETLAIEQVAPPKGDDDKRREFLEGVCYFGLFGNHVLIVQSNALSSKQVEAHFNWLLKKAKVVTDGNAVGLSDQIAVATKERIRNAHVKEVEIGAPFIEAETAPQSANREAVKDTSYNFKGIGFEMVRQILGAKLDSMKLADALDGNIEVSLRIRYKKKTTEKAHELLDNIALAIRNIDEDEVKLHLVGGGQVDGNQLKLSTQLRIEAFDGIPSYNELFQKMQQWLLDLLEKKLIEP